MKILFRQFIHDIRNYEEDPNMTDKTETSPQEVKLKAFQLFQELGSLFDKQLKDMMNKQQDN